MNAREAFEDLINCPICLERFVEPKALPCQHTFCLSCLESMTKNQKFLLCPQCRERHDIPSKGVQEFKDNLVIKNLIDLKLLSPENSPENGMADKCHDCKKQVSLSMCEHCSQQVCVDCRLAHNKLIWEIQSIYPSLEQLRQGQLSKKQHWQTMDRKLTEVVAQQKDTFQKLRKNLDVREEKLNTQTDAVRKAIDLVLSDKNISDNLDSVQLDQADTIDNLTGLKLYVANMRDLMLRMCSDKCGVEFLPGDLEDVERSLVSYGRVVVGGTELDFEEVTHKKESATGNSASGNERPHPKPRTRPANTNTKPAPQKMTNPTNASASRTSTPTSPRPGSTPSSPENEAPNTVSLLPRNVQYLRKGCAGFVRLQEQGPTIIGPYCTVAGQAEPYKVISPNCAILNQTNGRIYVSSSETNRILSVDEQGHHARLVFVAKQPNSMAVDKNGNLYVAESEGKIRMGDCQANVSRRLEEQPENVCADLIAYHENRLLVVDSSDKNGVKIHVLNMDGQLLKSLPVDLNSGSAVLDMTVGDGKIYLSVEDRGKCHVLVYSLTGALVTRFEVTGDELGDVAGILVDGDGYVVVARPIGNRLDVYSGQGVLICTFGRAGRMMPGELDTPTGLNWARDGRILVCDSENHRVQIL